MFDIGLPELMVILVIALFVFGAERLPEMGTNLGKAVREFKKGLSEAEPDERKKLKEENQKNNNFRNG
jgi:sec-independent protein translocase protein TatA